MKKIPPIFSLFPVSLPTPSLSTILTPKSIPPGSRPPPPVSSPARRLAPFAHLLLSPATCNWFAHLRLHLFSHVGAGAPSPLWRAPHCPPCASTTASMQPHSEPSTSSAQCATAGAPSPTPSPSASPAPPLWSPALHLRRRRRQSTLRRLLSRSSPSASPSPSPISADLPGVAEKGPLLRHTSLKDLFVASPEAAVVVAAETSERRPMAVGRWRWGGGVTGGGGRLRYRLLQYAWKLVLVSIPE